MLQAVIIAGGLATRLRPVTEKIPKSLIDINGEPFIFHQLRLLKKNGIEKIVLCLGYLGEQVVQQVGNGAAFGVSVEYSFDGDVLLGTGGCLRRALPLLDESFFVLYGDSYLPCDYRAVEKYFLAQKKPALMTVFLNHGQFDASNVEFEKGQIVRYSKTERDAKMQYIDYGLGAFHRSVIEALPEAQTIDLATVYQDLLAQHALAAYEVKQRFYESGSFSGIEELSVFLTKAC